MSNCHKYALIRCEPASVCPAHSGRQPSNPPDSSAVAELLLVRRIPNFEAEAVNEVYPGSAAKLKKPD